MATDISKSANKTLKIIYKEYLKRLKSGVKSDDAKLFGVGWENKLFPKRNIDELHESLYELKHKLNLRVYINCTFKLSSNCITYMESQSKNKINTIFKGILFFIKKFFV